MSIRTQSRSSSQGISLRVVLLAEPETFGPSYIPFILLYTFLTATYIDKHHLVLIDFAKLT